MNLRSNLVTRVTAFTAIVSFALGAHLQAAPLTIANPSFEIDADNTTGSSITGWNGSDGQFWVGLAGEAGNPPATIAVPDGTQFLTNARLSAGVGSQPVGSFISSDPVDISADAALIASGTAPLRLNFFYNNNDDRDTAELAVRFFSNNDGTGSDLGILSTGVLSDGNLTDGDFDWIDPWQPNTLTGLVPVGANSLVIEISSTRTGGSESNTAFDAFSGSIGIPEPSTALLLGIAVFGRFSRRRMVF